MAFGGRDEADDHVERGRLARAVLAEQADDFAGAHVDIDAVDDAPSAVLLDQAARLDEERRVSGVRRRAAAAEVVFVDGRRGGVR